MIDHKRKLLFLHIPKTAGRAIECAMTNKNVVSNADFYQASVIHRHAKMLDYGEYWQTYKTFTVVRNPYSRCLSAYRHEAAVVDKRPWWEQQMMEKSEGDFRVFVRDFLPHMVENRVLFYPQWSWLEPTPDDVLRFEDIDTEWTRFATPYKMPKLPRVLGPAKDLPAGTTWQSFYDDETAKRVAECYKLDFELTGYAEDWVA